VENPLNGVAWRSGKGNGSQKIKAGRVGWGVIAPAGLCADDGARGRDRGRLGRRSKVILAVLATGALVVGLVVFKPWLLFIDVRVDEQFPFVASQTTPSQPSPSGVPGGDATEPQAPPAAPAGPRQLAVRTQISHEHATTGTVRIVDSPTAEGC
jgi:hypothetical protein